MLHYTQPASCYSVTKILKKLPTKYYTCWPNSKVSQLFQLLCQPYIVPFIKRHEWNVAFVLEVHEMFNFVASDYARLLALFEVKKC